MLLQFIINAYFDLTRSRTNFSAQHYLLNHTISPVFIFLPVQIHFLLFQNELVSDTALLSHNIIFAVTCHCYFDLMKISNVKMTFLLCTLVILLNYHESIILMFILISI